MKPQDFISILYDALAQPIGLLFRTSDPQKVQQRLYAAKYKARDAALADLEIRMSPMPEEGDLIIEKKSAIASAKAAFDAETSQASRSSLSAPISSSDLFSDSDLLDE